ncbi:MAG: stage II sporulation protein R [Clostridia bacterium]|nr:stage II sporulation protein R [Clostridia bacterium]
MRYISKSKLFFLISVLTLIFALTITYAKNVGNNISNAVLRLHIIANSNSACDQDLKLCVRDRIISEAGEFFSNCQNLDDAIRITNERSQEIKKIAESEIQDYGFDYPVKVSIGNFAFPTKSYGDVTLPSGRYTALRIEIGEAKGENWWCVMYPPLCFADGVLSVTDAAKTQLKSDLEQSEYNLITQKDSGAIPVELRFKIVEIFQNIF